MYRFARKEYTDKLLRHRFKTVKRNQKNIPEDTSYLLGCFSSFFLLACLLRALARKKKEEKQPRRYSTVGFTDDSGYK